MKASAPSNDCLPRRGQVGIGALIIFIALLLVAILAVGLLLSTSGALQQNAESTGEDSIAGTVNQLSVVSERVRYRAVRKDTVSLSNDRITLSNISTTLTNSSESINQQFSTQFEVSVSSNDSVLLQGNSDTLEVEDGAEIGFANKTTGDGWKIVSSDNEIQIDDNTVSVINDTDGNDSEVLRVRTQTGEALSFTEGTSEEIGIQRRVESLSVQQEGTVTAAVNSGGSVILKEEYVSYTNEIIVYDGDSVVVTYLDDDFLRITNQNTSRSIEADHALGIGNDTDGVTGEELTLSNATSETVTIDENTGGKFGGEENYHINKDINTTAIVTNSGQIVSATVSSSGNVTVTDGGAALTVGDGDSLLLERTGIEELTVTNQDTNVTIVTESTNIEVVDDGDGTNGEKLSLGSGTTVNSSEDNDRQIRVALGTRETNQTAETVTLTVMKGPGSDAIDLSDTTIQVVGGSDSLLTFAGSAAAVPDAEFGVTSVFDEGDTLPVISSGEDRFTVEVQLTVQTDEDYTLTLTTASGASVTVEIDGDDAERNHIAGTERIQQTVSKVTGQPFTTTAEDENEGATARLPARPTDPDRAPRPAAPPSVR